MLAVSGLSKLHFRDLTSHVSCVALTAQAIVNASCSCAILCTCATTMTCFLSSTNSLLHNPAHHRCTAACVPLCQSLQKHLCSAFDKASSFFSEITCSSSACICCSLRKSTAFQASCLSLFQFGCTSIDPITPPPCCCHDFRDLDIPASAVASLGPTSSCCSSSELASASLRPSALVAL